MHGARGQESSDGGGGGEEGAQDEGKGSDW